MKVSKRVVLIPATIILLAISVLSVLAQSTAQAKRSDISSLAGKHRVYVICNDEAGRARMIEALRADPRLIITEDKAQADFFVERIVKFSFHSDSRYEATRYLPQLPDLERETRQHSRSAPGSETRTYGNAKTRIEVYFNDASGNRVIVWSGNRSSRFSDTPVVPVQAVSSGQNFRDYQRIYKLKDDDAKLTKDFVKDLKTKIK